MIYIWMSASQQDKHVNDSKLKQRMFSHLSASYYMMRKERERERDGCGLCFGFQRSDMLCYISLMTNASASVVEE